MTTVQAKPSLANVLGNVDFRLLWIGQGTSLLGDQFFLIAVTWLVLRLTNDPLVLAFLALAVYSERAFLPKISEEKPRALKQFRRALNLNTILGALLILLTSIAQTS